MRSDECGPFCELASTVGCRVSHSVHRSSGRRALLLWPRGGWPPPPPGESRENGVRKGKENRRKKKAQNRRVKEDPVQSPPEDLFVSRRRIRRLIMACRGFWECLLKLFNFLLTFTGLAMVGYGIYLLVQWNKISPGSDDAVPPPNASMDHELLKLGRPMLVVISMSSNFLDKLPKAWFIYLFIGIGVILFVISCFGCMGAVTRNGCCLSCYSFLVILLILVELGAAGFIFFDHSWRDLIPTDTTGDFDMMYNFLENNWKIAKWVALGAVILEALVFFLALIVRAANRPIDYDSDDEYIAPRSTVKQPLINRQGVPATGVPSTVDQRPTRSDAWSQRMREKYGLDTSEFTYNPSDPSRYQQAPPPSEETGRCTIL